MKRSAFFIALVQFCLSIALAETARARSAYIDVFAGVLAVDDSGVANLEGYSTDPIRIIGAELGFVLSPQW